ncbi:MAG: putative porin [Deltaproteobacteria bacterium]|nr:putative porin [Deltaproteobacteria bacterium]
MKRLHLSLLLCLSFVLLTGVQARGGDLADILEQKGLITEEEAREAREAREDQAKGKTFKLLEKIDFKGDLRLRHDTQWRDETDTTKVGVRLVSGSGFQNTTNQSFDGHARGKEIFIDRAYASWQPFDFLKIIGGKHKNPLFTTPLVWDPDVNSEGISESLNFDITDSISIFSNLGQWFIEELKIKDSDRDPTLLVFQLGTQIKPSKNIKFELAGTYYDFKNLDELDWDNDGSLSDTDTFLGYNNKYGQQMIFDNDEKLLNEFQCWEFLAKVKIKDVLPVPFSIFGNYIINVGADIDELMEKGVDPGDSDPADLAGYGSDDRDTGWLIGLSVGNKKKKGDWYAKYHYQVLEDYAFPAVFVDSDFHGGGTNNKGHYVHGRYFLADNIQARATGFFTERDDEIKDGKKDEDRVQLDIVINF